MGKKRKHSEREAAANVKKDESAPERPKRTLLGFKNSAEDKKDNDGPPVGFRNKEKVLVTCSRRINFRYRHLMLNLVEFLPHCKKDNKLVELKSCSSCLFFECPNGPSVKFLVNAWRFPNDICSICVFDVHTMEELKLTGNHLKGSCPILTFSSNFDQNPHWKLFKEMITQKFGTPKGHRKSKPYHDHIFVFSIADDHIWFRNYQILCPHSGAKKLDRGDLEKMTLVEVGPRFCLNPIKVFGGSFGGPTLYENPFYVSPNQKVKAKTRRKTHELANPLEIDEFADMWKE
ncbi:hypothetical protein Pfo_014146 [Paulownia fortunei]|nr:hypothetical protein Pfo_014146 [Paulownia fortunei]